VFVAANFIYGVHTINYWQKLVSGAQSQWNFCKQFTPPQIPPEECVGVSSPVSSWGPWAKLCGSLLNLNCALLLVCDA
jgi:hypothetical protein